MFHVYVLFSLKDRKLYVGYTTDIERRLKEHLAGSTPSTRDRRPLILIYYESYFSDREAERREKYLKGGKGRSELKRQLEFTLKQFHYKHL